MNQMVISYCRKRSTQLFTRRDKDRQDIAQIGILAALEAEGSHDATKVRMTTYQCYRANNAMIEATRNRRVESTCAMVTQYLEQKTEHLDIDRAITGKQMFSRLFLFSGNKKTVMIAHYAYGLSLKDCGKICNFTESRASQLHREAISELRKNA